MTEQILIAFVVSSVALVSAIALGNAIKSAARNLAETYVKVQKDWMEYYKRRNI